jgi:hypothetical protein
VGRLGHECRLAQHLAGGDEAQDALVLGALADQDALVGHVERFRDEVADELRTLRAIEPTNTRTGHDAYHWYLLELGIEQAELRVRWAHRVLDDLRARRRS